MKDSKIENRLNRLTCSADEETARRLICKEARAKKLLLKNSRLKEFWDDVCDSFQMIAKIFSGEFKDYAWTDLAWIVGGLVYLISPVDAIPDPIPFWGLTDDAGALGIAFSRSGSILQNFRMFVQRGLVSRTVGNIGVGDSLKNTLKRIVGNDIAVCDPPSGTPLLVELAHALEHTGVYLGDGEVMEVYDGEDGGEIRVVSLKKFLCGDGFPRTGNEIYAACAAGSAVDRRPLGNGSIADCARRFRSENNKVNYNILKSNCHMFTASCVIGHSLYLNRNGNEGVMKKVVKEAACLCAAVARGTFSIKCLTDIISKYLNGKGKVEWCRVPGWTRSELT